MVKTKRVCEGKEGRKEGRVFSFFFFQNLPSMKHFDLLLREQHHETLLVFGDFSDLILVWNDVIFCFRMIGIS